MRSIARSELGTLMEVIATYCPDVIVIDDQLLASYATRLLQISRKHPQLRVISMSLSDNHLYIFDQKQMLVSQSKDFLSLV